MAVLGLDTSNYTTSVAVFDGQEGWNRGTLLPVQQGQLGLRQSEALFHHVKQLPALFRVLEKEERLQDLQAVGASTRPRAVEGSYMPCFLAGSSQGEGLAATLGVPFYEVSHQEGHLAAAAWSAGRMDLLDQPFLAWHLSGGTTELLYVTPAGWRVDARRIGGTQDISAGQLIDRTGILLGLPFPAGRGVDVLSEEWSGEEFPFLIKNKGLEFSLSGIENKVKERYGKEEPPGKIARFVLETVSHAVRQATKAAQKEFGALPVLFCGGVAANRRLRKRMEGLDPIFAQPSCATDNALGVAVLTNRALLWEEKE